jgi:expansin (peptidoglycan-binding protein)
VFLREASSIKLTLVKDSGLFSQSICGKSVHITNTANGKSVTVVVADECPTCANPESIDLSTGAFDRIGDPATGVLQIEWEFV